MLKKILKGFSGKSNQKPAIPNQAQRPLEIKKPQLQVVQSGSPTNISRLFISSILGDSQFAQSRQSNSIDQTLLSWVRQELANPEIDNIPKLAQASMNLMQVLINDHASADELVKLVEQDPILLGKVLDLANSAFYKTSTADIDNLSHALVLLGNKGLKKLIMGTLVTEKLKISSIYFKVFGANIWKHSHDVAVMAAEYSKKEGANEFRAYFNGLLHDIGKLVIFKLLIQALQEEAPDTYPTPAFFTKVIEHYGTKLTLTVLREWSLQPDWIKPIMTYQSRIPVENMDIDTRALYTANWCSELHFLSQKEELSDEQLEQLLINKGIDLEIYTYLTSKL